MSPDFGADLLERGRAAVRAAAAHRGRDENEAASPDRDLPFFVIPDPFVAVPVTAARPRGVPRAWTPPPRPSPPPEGGVGHDFAGPGVSMMVHASKSMMPIAYCALGSWTAPRRRGPCALPPPSRALRNSVHVSVSVSTTRGARSARRPPSRRACRDFATPATRSPWKRGQSTLAPISLSSPAGQPAVAGLIRRGCRTRPGGTPPGPTHPPARRLLHGRQPFRGRTVRRTPRSAAPRPGGSRTKSRRSERRGVQPPRPSSSRRRARPPGAPRRCRTRPARGRPASMAREPLCSRPAS